MGARRTAPRRKKALCHVESTRVTASESTCIPADVSAHFFAGINEPFSARKVRRRKAREPFSASTLGGGRAGEEEYVVYIQLRYLHIGRLCRMGVCDYVCGSLHECMAVVYRF